MSDKTGVDVFVSELETGSSNSSGVYPFLPLRDEIRDLGLDTGDQVKGSYEADEDEIAYVRYEPYTEDSNSRYAVNIQSRSDRRFSYHLSVNAEYLSNPDSPFYEKEPGDRMVVELDRQEKEIRTYDPDDHGDKGMGEGYKLRHSPSLAPFVLGSEEEEQVYEINEGEVDVAAKTKLDGDRFLVGGFDKKKFDQSPKTNLKSSMRMRSRVSVYWDPEPEEVMEPDPMYHIGDAGSETLNHAYILPEKGMYQFVMVSETREAKDGEQGVKEVWRWKGETWLAYDESDSLSSSLNISGNWYAPAFSSPEEDDDDPVVYTPLERVEKVKKE